MRGAQGEVDTATLPVTVTPVQRMGHATCRVTQAETDRHIPGASLHPPPAERPTLPGPG
jgi:hypothetical protein